MDNLFSSQVSDHTKKETDLKKGTSVEYNDNLVDIKESEDLGELNKYVKDKDIYHPEIYKDNRMNVSIKPFKSKSMFVSPSNEHSSTYQESTSAKKK